MATDDPGVLEPGGWEIIVAAIGAGSDVGNAYDLPVVDLSYGLTSSIQLGAVAARAVSDPDNDSSRSGLGLGDVNIKWQFFANDKLELATGLAYTFPMSDSSKDRGLVDDLRELLIPVIAAYDFGPLYVNSEAGYIVTSSGDNAWKYGTYVGVPAGDRLEFLAEVFGGNNDGFDEGYIFYNVGVDIGFTESFHLLASVGSAINDRTVSPEEEADWIAFLGLQWFP